MFTWLASHSFTRPTSVSLELTWNQSTLSGDVLYILIAKEDTDAFLKLNDYTYAGAQLTIAESHEPWPGASAKPELSTGAQQAKEGLRNVLSARYDINRKLLDLSSLSTDHQLSQMGIIQAGSGGSLLEKAFKALLIVCDQQFTSAQAKRDSIPSITLANNNISNVTQVFDLAETFPDLKNLDLSNNQLDNLRKLTPWRHRFRSLETLILTGNPLEAAEPNYQADILTWFPKLQILNNIQVRTPEQIEAAAAAVHLNPIPQAGYDFRDAGGVGERFVKQFFLGYDSNRQQLAATFYDERSTFSLAVSVSAPHDAGSRVPPWKPYLGYSRNLTKITSQGAREQRLFRGPEAISKIWAGLPQTRHPSLETDSHKYIIDCHVLSGLADPSGQSPNGVDGLIITIHGEFEEAEPLTDKIGMRSFTRTFVLGPGGPGGSDVRVSSDMLALRAHTAVPSMQSTTNGEPIQATQPQLQPQPQPQQIPAAPQSLLEPSVEVKKQMVYELSKRSNMILQISEQCLMEADWNLDVAWNVFEQKKVSDDLQELGVRG
jgi:nuclear RNA export factor